MHTSLIDEVKVILEEVQDIQKWSESKKESEAEVKTHCNTHTLYTDLSAFPVVMTRKICLTLRSILNW